jgi:ribose-phosphate pyrophosphokinase
VLLVDDLCATAETVMRAAKACRDAGAAAVYAAITHIPVTEGIDAVEGASTISGVVVTDSTGIDAGPTSISVGIPRRTTLSIAPVLGQAMRRIRAAKPLSPVLESWPVTFEE